MTFLSNERMHDPCTTSAQGITCTSPIGTLGRGGVLAGWTVGGLPMTRFDTLAGKNHTFGHGHARVEIEHPDEANCEESVRASFVYQHFPSHDALLTMDACINGPGVQRIERQLMAMLASTTVHRTPVASRS